MKLLLELLFIALIFVVLIGLLIFLIYRVIKKKYIERMQRIERRKKASIPKKEISPLEKRKTNTPVEYKLYMEANKMKPVGGAMYHLNSVGVVHKCTTDTFMCRYELPMHDSQKSKLYKHIIYFNTMDKYIEQDVLEDMLRYKSLRNLHAFSSAIAKSETPLEIIVATLGKASITLTEEAMRKSYYSSSKRAKFEKSVVELIEEICTYSGSYELKQLGDAIPSKLLNEAMERFRSSGSRCKPSEPQTLAEEMEDTDALLSDGPTYRDKYNAKRDKLIARLLRYSPEFKLYQNDPNWLVEDNSSYDYSYGWFIYAFEQFADILNASKIIQYPLLYIPLEEAIAQLKQMDNATLLGALDNMCTLEQNFDEVMKNANYFNFINRNDLTDEANVSLSKWFKRMRDAYLKYMQIPKEHVTALKNAAYEEAKPRRLHGV